MDKFIRADDSLEADKSLLESSKNRKYLDESTVSKTTTKITKVAVSQSLNEIKTIDTELKVVEFPKFKLNPLTLSNGFKTLLPGEWISSFIIDDVISYLIINYGKEKCILYIPSGIYEYFYAMQDNTNILQKFLDTDILKMDLILITINTHLRGEHWILGIIHLKLKMIIILDSLLSLDERKEHFLCLLQITYLCYNASNYCNETSLKFYLSEWQCVYANDSIQQSNMFDCGLYVCLHAFCYVTDTYFFNTPSNDGREWLYYNSKKYSELNNQKLIQDHTYFKKYETKLLNSEDIKNLKK